MKGKFFPETIQMGRDSADLAVRVAFVFKCIYQKHDGRDLDYGVQEEIILWVGGSGNYNEQRIYVIASDGSINSGWSYTYRADYDLDHYDFANADMDRDGTV